MPDPTDTLDLIRILIDFDLVCRRPILLYIMKYRYEKLDYIRYVEIAK